MGTEHLKVQVSMDHAGVIAGIAKMKSLVAGAIPQLAALAAAIGGPAVFAAGIKGALNFGSAMDDLKRRTGVAIPELMKMRTAFTAAGIGADAVGPMMNKMQKAIAGAKDSSGAQAKTFASMGISMSELGKLKPDEQFLRISGALEGVKNQSDKVKAAMEIFGKGGGAILAVTAEDFRDAAGFLGSTTEIMARNSAKFDRASDLLSRSGEKFEQFFVGVAAQVVDVMLPVLEMFDKIDFAAFGQRFGAALRGGIEVITGAFQQGRITELMLGSFTFVATQMENIFAKAFAAITASGFTLFRQLAITLASPEFWSAFLAGWEALSAKAARSFYNAFMGPTGVLNQLQAGWEIMAFQFEKSRKGLGDVTPGEADAITRERQAKGTSFFGIGGDVLDEQVRIKEAALGRALEKGTGSAFNMAEVVNSAALAWKKAGLSGKALAEAEISYGYLVESMRQKMEASHIAGGPVNPDGEGGVFSGGGSGPRFDSLRKVGANLAGVGNFVTDRMISLGEKQLDRLISIDNALNRGNSNLVVI